jgi:hypothetical protein
MKQFTRNGIIYCQASIQQVFSLLCPKREEEWIPGWECQTLWSKSGYNEEGAIFKTAKPYGTELYWVTLQYDIANRIVDFLITAPHLFMMRYIITVDAKEADRLAITFNQTFTSVSDEGDICIDRYQQEDLQARLNALKEYLQKFLDRKQQAGK